MQADGSGDCAVRVTQTRRIERAGVNAVRALLEEHDQIVQEIDGGNDYGEDLFVMFTKDGQRTGVSVAIQVKSGAKYKRSNGYSIPVDGHFDDWKNSLLPVLGVVFDVDTRQLFWVNLSAVLNDSVKPLTWVGIKTESELGGSTIQQFIKLVHEYAEGSQATNRREVNVQVYPVPEPVNGALDWFVGRKSQCELIQDKLVGGVGRKFLIAGMAGVGKTSLVNKVIGNVAVRAEYSGGAIFADMHGFSGDRRSMSRPSAAYAPLLAALGVPTSDIPADSSRQAATYHEFLERSVAAGRSILFVFDNVAEVSQVAELLPKSETHGVIITSRVRLGIIDGVETVHLDCLTPDESEILFRAAFKSRSSSLPEDASIQQLCELCGHLPLALNIAAAVVKGDPYLNVGDFLEELQEAKSRLDVLQYGDTAVRAALEVSFGHLEEDLRDPFCRISINPGSQISEEIAGVLMGVSTPRARTVLRRLSQVSLISRSPSLSQWRMHDLVYLFSSEKSEEVVNSAERAECFTRMAERYYVISDEADSILRGGIPADRERFSAISEALTWFDDEYLNLRGTARRAHEAGLYEDAYFLSMTPVLFCDMRGRVDDALQCAVAAYEAARAAKNVEWQVRALNNVGLVLTTQRKFKNAIQKLTKAAAIAERIGFLEGESDATTSLGAAVRQHNGPSAAVPVLVKAVELAKRTGNSSSIGGSLTNLGSAYRESGQLGSAARVLSESIPFHRRSGNRRKEASAHGGLAAALSQMGQFDAALKSFEDAFAGYRAVQDDFGIYLGYSNLGGTYLAMGRIAEAKNNLERARSYFESVGNIYYEAGALANLGQAEHALGNFERARSLHENARAKYESIGAAREIRTVEGYLRKLRKN
ncbi:tetratricopeptide repeat protein [Streptomyces prunicolor]|uniref:Tetratricopeptide repeat protein n=1 Tax=Streptomyces prunicolor TaxID=67348 RepID=A0ABU4FHQ7_9ACTN|nr:tetratricopeptide repeat protein [Streptomyces prunicolor]MDV7220141.1 tetratricopeptide repeat protein [Streptomyces prunicolor]